MLVNSVTLHFLFNYVLLIQQSLLEEIRNSMDSQTKHDTV